MMNATREAGVLLPISALPSPYGIGCFSDEAYRFVDMLAQAGQGVWQILPLCPTSMGDSPYQSPCSFGGNPYFISPEHLRDKGLLTDGELSEYGESSDTARIDYGELYKKRYPLLKRAYSRFCQGDIPEGYPAFLAENSVWLEELALFMAIKESLLGAPLWEFPHELLSRAPEAMEDARRRLGDSIGFWKFLQFEFYEQWSALRAYANQRGIRIMGDIPIYVSADSVEVWAFPELFVLDGERRPLSVAGCPPDGFTPKGQLWGNPLYNWSEHRASGYAWWTERVAHAFSMYDVVRIDHFRGFESYYSVPYGADDATGGHWERGVGKELFNVIRESLGAREIIAEDLGYMTEGVRRLVSDCGFSGMKILQFGFDVGDTGIDSEYLPHNYPKNSVVYTGTHDNPTLLEWLEGLSYESEAMLREYLRDSAATKHELADKLISLAMMSRSRLCIIPMQDYLMIGKEGRMNHPSSASGNWTWRMKKEDIGEETGRRIRAFTAPYGRLIKNKESAL